MLFLEVADKHAPIKTKRLRAKKSPWISPQLKANMQHHDRLKCKAIHTNDKFHWSEFKKFKNLVNSEIKKAKASYFQQAFNTNAGDSRRTWQIVND